MRTKIAFQQGRVALFEVDKTKSTWDQNRLATLTQYADLPCWNLCDIRLAQWQVPSKYSGDANAESYSAYEFVADDEEAEFVKTLLHNYIYEVREFVPGKGIQRRFNWATNEGVVPGPKDIGEYSLALVSTIRGGYFGYKEGIERLKEMQAFWEAEPHLSFSTKLANPNRQPSPTAIFHRLLVRKHEKSSMVI